MDYLGSEVSSETEYDGTFRLDLATLDSIKLFLTQLVDVRHTFPHQRWVEPDVYKCHQHTVSVTDSTAQQRTHSHIKPHDSGVTPLDGQDEVCHLASLTGDKTSQPLST